ncbi:F-box domain containing protein [Trema orientale]|uniref:F-box domain containing protein n=1 Tax=Trema orientale TaxID=63057 RepID=A0A2P5D5W0_TREOI|nr:F-box domain containing protein [Trema orientale]
MEEDQAPKYVVPYNIGLFQLLPDHVIHHIMSFLPTTDAVRMSVLSKHWRRMWYSVPALNFCPTDFCFRQKSDEEIYKIIDKCLEQREKGTCHATDSVFTRFKLDVNYGGTGDSLLKKWLNFAIENNTEELDLLPQPKLNYYLLPEEVFSSRSLTLIKLDRVKLEGSYSVNLPYLKTLSLTSIEFRGNNNRVLENLISGCPSLEKLMLNGCIGLLNPRISSSSLKFLEIASCVSCRTIQLQAANLRSFSYNSAIACDIIHLCACKEIRNLSLVGVLLDDRSLENLVLSLPLLESLTVHKSNFGLKHVKIASKSLKCLVLKKFFNKDVSATIKTPNLVSFCYEGHISMKVGMSSNSPNPFEGNIKLEVGDHLKYTS